MSRLLPFVYLTLVLSASNLAVKRRAGKSAARVVSGVMVMVQPAIQAPDDGQERVDAIDHEHFARMTFGDRSLQREILQLFDRQTGLLLERMRVGDAAALAALAHTLCGSARGIGAWAVAQAAEASGRAAGGTVVERDLAMEDLAAAVAEARLAVAELLKAV
jgi:hypothetical protein